ncbi:hypothetical protein UFOVP450_182 [uncultured Caudovirales phage]|uniref:Uncharacterized protein n=1 Tax=uncultured Caudovirales phage TaxID=2100421 RepID=A0A6J5MAB7_9CAUD|nr:hypothetical protein UFOVP450_182 [uncultured Caudovirales phage]
MPLREAEGDEEEAGGENPFAAAGGEEGGGEEAPADDAAAEEPAADDAAAEEGGEEETAAAKPKADLKYPVKFNIGKVKKYNNADFISGEGELKSINSKGMVVTVQPDNVDVFVNFSDIID